jgi:hypothetical protein
VKESIINAAHRFIEGIRPLTVEFILQHRLWGGGGRRRVVEFDLRLIPSPPPLSRVGDIRILVINDEDRHRRAVFLITCGVPFEPSVDTDFQTSLVEASKLGS